VQHPYAKNGERCRLTTQIAPRPKHLATLVASGEVARRRLSLSPKARKAENR